MSSMIENNKPNNRNRRLSNSGSNSGETTAVTSSKTQASEKEHNSNSNSVREEAEAKRTKKRRPTKVGLNDILRHIRHLMVEGRSNLEIQDILQLEERTFYRYMAKIHEIDQVLFAEQEKKTMTTEIGILKDRWLKAYRWYIAIAENENMKADIRMEAQRNAADVALALLKVEREGPKVVEQGGLRTLEKLYLNSR